MANTRKVCKDPTMAEKMMAKLAGRPAPKQKCKRVKVNKNDSNSIASSINWGNQHKSS